MDQVGTIKQISISEITISKEAVIRTFKNMKAGRFSRQGFRPIDVFLLNEDKIQYLLKDGCHRLFEYLLLQRKEIYIEIIEIGTRDSYYGDFPNNKFVIDPEMKYGGLEALFNAADLEEIRKML